MIPVYYDLHIHSALSPCADDDMTPNDIVGMAILNGLDLIAVTDHNSFANVAAVMKAASAAQTPAGNELIVLPGIEVSTIEEVHVICLFRDMESALNFEAELTPLYSTLANRTDIFGNQLVYDEEDCVTGEIKRMLIAPVSISFDDLYHLTGKYGGAFIPAHIDRESFSVMSNLGFLPPHLSINTVEVTRPASLPADKNVIFSSDAHQLWTINERKHFLMLPERTAKAAIDFLR